VKTKKYSKLKPYVISNKWKFIILIMFTCLVLFFNLMLPQFIRLYIDNITLEASILIGIAMAFIAAVILKLVFALVSSVLSERLGISLSKKIRKDLFKHCVNLDMSFHNKFSKGNLIERLDTDVSFIGDFLSRYFVSLFSSVAIILSIIIILFFVHPYIFLALLIPTLLIPLCIFRLHNLAVPRWEEAKKTSANTYGLVQEYIRGRDDVVSRFATKYILDKLGVVLDKYLVDFRRAMVSSKWSSIIVNSLFFIGDGLALGTSIYLFINDQITLGELYLVFNYVSLLFGPWQMLESQIVAVGQANASFARIDEIFSATSKLNSDHKGFPTSENSEMAIEFKDVIFEYSDRETVLKNISFDIAKGKHVGIIGRTGSGKSTIINLITYLYKIKSGSLLIDGAPIDKIPQNELRKKIVLIPQKVDIFTASFRENIILFNKDFKDDYLLECVNKLGLSKWFQNFKNGLDTNISRQNLSEGECQLISLILAYIKNPEIIIFDEATAHLDPITEKLLNNSYQTLLKGKTAVIVAHRLKTLEKVDEIILVKEGKIAEHESRAVLEADSNSEYAKLLKKEAGELIQ